MFKVERKHFPITISECHSDYRIGVGYLIRMDDRAMRLLQPNTNIVVVATTIILVKHCCFEHGLVKKTFGPFSVAGAVVIPEVVW